MGQDRLSSTYNFEGTLPRRRARLTIQTELGDIWQLYPVLLASIDEVTYVFFEQAVELFHLSISLRMISRGDA